MIALAYLVVMVLVGDMLSRRWLPPTGRPQRLATAFLVGLLVCTWATYLVSNAAGESSQPLTVGNAVLLGMVGPVAVLDAIRRWRRGGRSPARVGRRELWDWVFVAALVAFVTWTMTATLQFGDGELRVGIHEFGDFGPNLAIAQGFAIGHNFPTEYPLFAGAPILYHFLFYFQAGNLTFLGFDPALATNVLSIGSMVAMLVVLAALGERLFRSVAVGRLGAALFFFHGSLSFVPYLASFPSPAAAIESIPRLGNYLPSGFPYHGEDWAIWSLNVFLNQRHLASAIGILLVVLLFVVDRAIRRDPSEPRDRAIGGYVLCGLLLGLLPLWNGGIYVAAAVVLGVILVVYPGRPQLAVLGLAAALVSVPQLVFLRPEGSQATQYPAFHWGYVVTDATPLNVAIYLAFLFGPKLILMSVALAVGSGLQRRFFVAIASLVALAFLFRFTIDIAQNHKFLSTWLIVANLFAAYGLVRLWRARGRLRGRSIGRLPGRLVAAALAFVIGAGGAIDLVPIANDTLQRRQVSGDPLFEWLRAETDPRAVFLSDIHVHHPILLAGRKLYLGWPAYPFSMGYDMAPREASYRRLLSSRNARAVVRELQDAGIDYVAIDDGVREGAYVEDVNEALYRDHFRLVYDDAENRYRHLAIYRVPTDPEAWRSMPGAPAVDMFTGGHGDDSGRFDGPRGIGVASDGTVLVADTGNQRIQRFASDGTYLGEFGSPGDGPGQLDEPNGVAVDSRGHAFVADTLNDRVQEFDPAGTFLAEWRGPEPGFYGPRDVAIGEDDTVYVLDQGRARVVVRSPDGSQSAFGSLGGGDGQLDDPTGLGLGGGLLAVADPTNGRIAVFDAGGRFLRSIPVPQWGATLAYPDVAVTADGGLILATSPSTNEVLVFSADGAARGSLRASGPHPLEEPGSIAARADGTFVVIDLPANRVSVVEP